jgi:hypothetical protein
MRRAPAVVPESDSVEPRRTNERIDMADPAVTKSHVLSAEPTRANARSDSEEPRCTKLRTEQVDDMRT